MKDVGMRIRNIRQKKNMTLEDLGEKLGKTKSYISKLERAEKPINLQNLQAIADALEVDIVELFPNKEKIHNPFTNEEDWSFVIHELKKRGFSAGDIFLKIAQEAIEKDKKE